MTDRAQTLIDFAIGASVFLIVVGVVFAFVPSMFEPFSAAGGSSPIVADRTADHLTESMLVADPANPSVLSAACTAVFFGENETLAENTSCGFATNDSTAELLGVDTRNVNVTVREPSDSPSTGPAVKRSVDDTEYTLTRGTEGVPSDVSTASRIVLIEGDRYRLVVKVW